VQLLIEDRSAEIHEFKEVYEVPPEPPPAGASHGRP
jgi:hypothetical protein